MFAWATQFLTGTMNWYPLISCTLFLVPGIPLINAVDDFLNNFIVSGMTRAIHTLLIVGAIPEWLDLISHRTERIRFMKKEEQRLAKSTKPE